MKKSELELLKEKVRKLEILQARCDHNWQEPFEDSYEEEIKEVVYTGMGLDRWPSEYGTGRYKTVKCFARECSKCGKIERTTNMEEVPVATKKVTKF